MKSDRDLSEHSVDRLIRELVRTRRAASYSEIGLVLDRIGPASFDTRLARIPVRERGLIYDDRVVRDRDDQLFVHLVRRVLIDRQWALGTTMNQYLDDLHRAPHSIDATLSVYSRRGGHLATVLTRTNQVLAAPELGPLWLPELVVVYSADQGIIASGYQASSRDAVGIPKDAQWLL